MGTIVVSDNVSLDGVFQDPAGDEGFARGGWVGLIKDRPELARLALDEAMGAEAMLMGRRTYEWFAARWPSRSGPLADRLNSMPKYVVSSTLVDPDWNNSTVVRGELLSEVSKLKAELTGEIVVPASSGIVRTLMKHGLVDELRLKVFPVVLGAGERLFGETDGTKAMRLVDVRTLDGDTTYLIYEGVQAQSIGDTMTSHNIGTRDEWVAAREQLLVREKEHTRLGDEIARQRRELPWVRLEKEYRLDTDDGEKAIGELFDGRSQLLVYHFMFGPSYEAGCPVNSSIADSIDGVLPHLHARDVTFMLVSQAPLEKLQAYKRGWAGVFRGPRLRRTDFNFDLGFSYTEEQAREAVAQMRPTGLATGSETGTGLPPIVEQNASSSGTDVVGYLTESPGFSAFVLEDGAVYHAYSTTWRGLEFLMGYYPILDHAPKGRDEGEAWQLWIRRHDEYESDAGEEPPVASVV